MRGIVAKRLRQLAYGKDESHRDRKYTIRKRIDSQNRSREHLDAGLLRVTYQHLKRD